MENKEITKEKPVLDLRPLNIPLSPISKKLNGKPPFNRGETGRFEKAKPSDKRGIILQALIYGEFMNLEGFATSIGKTKGWVSMLIYTPNKVKIGDEILEKICKALKVNVLL